MRKTRTGITIKTHEVFIIRASHRASRNICQQCQGQTLMVTLEEAMVLANTSVRAIYRWVEAGRVHYTESTEGALLVCPDSILRLAIKTDLSD